MIYLIIVLAFNSPPSITPTWNMKECRMLAETVLKQYHDSWVQKASCYNPSADSLTVIKEKK